MTVFKGVYGLQFTEPRLCSCVGSFLRVYCFLGGETWGMCSPKIGEPSLATEGYKHRLRGMNVSKRLVAYSLQTLTYNL